MSPVWNDLFKRRVSGKSGSRGDLRGRGAGACQYLSDSSEDHDVDFRTGSFFRNHRPERNGQEGSDASLYYYE